MATKKTTSKEKVTEVKETKEKVVKSKVEPKKATAKSTSTKKATTTKKTSTPKKSVTKKETSTTLPNVTISKKKKILFVGSECAPYMATGGLADVMGSLPNALADNAEISVVLPLYSAISQEYRSKMENLGNFTVKLSWRQQYCGIFRLIENGVTYYFIDNEYYFKRSGNIYGFYDDGERFGYFSKAVLDMLKFVNYQPDILHCNDWQTAATVIYLKSEYFKDAFFANMKTIFTIHNIEYQGIFDMFTYGDIFGFDMEVKNIVEFDGNVNLMKGAIELSDVVSTVSPTYAEEIKSAYFAHGLDGIIGRNSQKLCGILNGIDVNYYNPETDKYLFKNYNATDFSGKKVCKAELQKLVGLPIREDVPVIAMISRLVSHKGLDLLKGVIESLLSEDVQVVILGKGDNSYENYFTNVAKNYSGKCVTIIAYNQDLSRKIYSGADIFLMPSKMEPCGLSQMIASRYGTIPVVRETGGLNDSIKAYTGESGNGFTFKNYNAHDMLYVINEAVRLYKNKPEWEKLIKVVMTTDFSWKAQAIKYEQIYDNI